ncbi:E492 group microcin [Martelella alba]|uniref:E492 group microcin n=1 Tax=Martelella alba TaxID=2590451 RepID=UPI00403D532E
MFRCTSGSENKQMACSIGRDMAIGAAGGAAKAGLPGALVAAGSAAVQNVGLRLIDHGPVNVHMPQVPMNPSHIGNSGNNSGAMPKFPMGPSWTNHR